MMNVDLERVRKILEWVKSQVFLDAISGKAKARFVKRGDVYRCNFGCGIGSEMQKDRPAVIIQNDPSNKSSGNTIVIPITHDAATMSCMAPITTQYDNSGSILLDGTANASNLMCISKARLGNYVCTLPASDMREIETALAKTVDLMKHYAALEAKYKDKLGYIGKIREERNTAQDELASIRAELGINEDESIIEKLKALKVSARRTDMLNEK